MLRVTRRDGESVRIPEAALVAGKVVPGPPARRGGTPPTAPPAELQRIAALSWPATENEPLGDWLLRAAGGFTRRANSALATGDPGLPLPEALRRTAAWYRERGLTPRVQVPADGPLDARIAAEGWPAEARTVQRTASLARLAALPETAPVVLGRDLEPGWLARYRRAEEDPEAAAGVLTGGGSVWFASVPAASGGTGDGGTEDGVTVGGGTEGMAAGGGTENGVAVAGTPAAAAAIGRVTVHGRWAVLAAIEVDPALRRRGLGTAVLGVLARAARAEGATGALLQAEAADGPAAAFYDRLDFTTLPGHHYRCPPAC